ncbi:MAG TPA: alkanesulfonate monooxygenase, partial [Pseudonocardiaceae bacterium]
VGSVRALEFAHRQDVYDRALWTKTAAVTNASGASTALVGTPETVAAAILDYIDLGADLVSIRGYDNLNDTIDYGRYVLPLVRQELAHREATGRRGRLQAENLGALSPSFTAGGAR